MRPSLVYLPLLLGLLFAALPSHAQKENLSGSMDFFQKQTAEYQRWLDAKGLGKALKVDQTRFKKDKKGKIDNTELELLLLMESTDLDTAIGQWNQLKKEFDSDADSLEAFLYRAFVHKMEIPEAQGNIQVYIKDAKHKYIPCFYIWIWHENGRIATQKKIGACKDKKFEVSIPPYRPKTTGRGKTAKIGKSQTRPANEVFDLILQHVRATMLEQPRYQTELKDRKPRIENDSARTATTFKFTIADLGKEVLTNQTRTIWEKWVGLNTIAMERLHFQFEYAPVRGGGFTLKCIIDGKYGSGVFRPRTSGYLNMEPDFDDFFETYKNNFKTSLQKKLEGRP